ncbi:MAG TPA: DNA polymerase IV [Spirochaetota bacterium]|nr:DNA polymerase IV [Spirochaetota bacterium]HOM09294.1 DNA polymerase IV [Spirochaetota bacterium]HPP49307.1 DNA polymerase IV [Spirochaetota bacterium]
MKDRIILHVDMDAFFTSVEQVDNPSLKGKPVVVGADPKGGRGRGVVSAASYEARRFGIHSGMPISQAYKLCPGAVFLPPRFDRYVELSHIIMKIFERYSPCIEQISIDEAFLDCTGTLKLFGNVENIARNIKTDVFTQTGLTCSIGIASNKLVAKIASDLQKPDGLTICPCGMEKDFLAPLSIAKLYGVGIKTQKYLESSGYKTIGDIQRVDENFLQSLLGKWGVVLHQFALGIDRRPVEPYSQAKSVSEETTFDVDTDDEDSIIFTLVELCDRVIRRVRAAEFSFKTVTLKIRLEGFETYTRSKTLQQHARDMATLQKEIMRLYISFGRGKRKVRLLGVKVSNLLCNADVQMNLFENQQKVEKIEEVIDSIHNRGLNVLRASVIKPPKKKG